MPLPLAPTPTDLPVVIDGVLDEPAWETAAAVGPLVQYNPAPGGSTQDTEVRFLATAEALVVGVRARGDQALQAPLSRRDQTLFQDWVEVMLDTFHDGQRAFVFRVTPRGVQSDGIYVEGGDLWMQDLAWDAAWDSAARIDGTSWTAEVAIPWRALRYPRAEAQDWRLMVVQFTPHPWTLYTWPAVSPDAASFIGAAATFLPSPPPPRGVQAELLPTLTTTWEPTGASPADDGLGTFRAAPSVAIEVGASGRVALSSSAVFDLALNPDYSQVEADADKVTANKKYPLHLDEKRPFFLESSDLFEASIPLVYTRSIVDPLGGYKLSGRAGGLALGWLGAFDERPAESTISIDYATGKALPTWDAATVDGVAAIDHLARARYDLGGGASVGVLATDRELVAYEGADLADAGTPGAGLGNRVGALDAVVPLGEEWIVQGQVAGSSTDFEPRTWACAPSASCAAPGPGVAWSAEVERSGERVSFELEQFGKSATFRAENGFLREVDRVAGEARATLHFRELPGFRLLDLTANGEAFLAWDGTPTWIEAGPKWSAFFGPAGYTEGEAIYIRERVFGLDFDRWSAEGFAAYSPTQASNLWVGWDVGPTPHYQAAALSDLYLGWTWSGSAGGSWTFFDRLSLNEDFQLAQFRRAWDGALVYETILERLQADLGITRELTVRAIGEWNSFDGTVDSSLLLAWMRNYGTAAWVGYQETYDLGVQDWTSRAVFAKVSLLWMP